MSAQNMECIVLAGGMGTRLRGTIGELPKCMAPVGGAPFLSYLFRYLSSQGVTKVVLSLGFKSEVVIDWLRQSATTLPFAIDWVVEAEPLGTGGGIRLAMAKCSAPEVFVLNGDTLFLIDMLKMQADGAGKMEATLALKPMQDFSRYGIVQTNDSDTITSFQEKMPRESGDINGGIYLLRRDLFLQRTFPPKFSFEKDYLEQYVSEGVFAGWRSDAYFIDIGVPEDYQRAKADFQSIFVPA